MSAKPVIARERAARDVEEALDHYCAEAGEGVALGFVAALERAYLHISRYPASGSSRYSYELNLAGLKLWPLKRFPYLAFYIECETHVDVWRVLHAERDIPAWMRVPDLL